MRYGILGPLQVTGRDGTTPVQLGGLQRRLLAALLLAPNRVVSSERLVDAVWDGAPPADPRPALHVHITRLRQHVGDDLRTEAPGYRLAVAASELDALAFEDLLGRARRLERDGLRAEAAETLEEALALWRGEPAEGLDAPGFEASVERLRRLRQQAAEDHADLVRSLRRGHSSIEDVPVSDPTPSGPAEDRVRAQIRSLLVAARPHPVPVAVIRHGVGAKLDTIDRALRDDPATASAGQGAVATWRLMPDVAVPTDPTGTDRLLRACLDVAATTETELTGPTPRDAAAVMRPLSPIVVDAVATASSELLVDAAASLGRWWSLEGRTEHAAALGAAVLDNGIATSPRDLWAVRWVVDLAGRAGDGALVTALVRRSLPPEPPDEILAEALWYAIQGYVAELQQDLQSARNWFLGAADRWDTAGRSAEVVACLCNAAAAARLTGDPDAARAVTERARSEPAAVVAPLPRHMVAMTDATNAFDTGEFGAARDAALQGEAMVRGLVDRLADRAAMLAAEAAFFRNDLGEARATASRASPARDARTRVLAGFVRAEVELAAGSPARAVRVLETTWAESGDLLKHGMGSILAGTYARIAAAVGRDDLAVDLLDAAPRGSGPWARLDDELRDRLGAGSGTGDELAAISRAREILIDLVSRM